MPSPVRYRFESGSGRLLMISDLHIWGVEDPLYRALLKFLRSTVQEGDKLFIVGDLFDVFLGCHDVFRKKFGELIRTMEDLGSKRGVEIFYLEGNHDFYLDGVFSRTANVHVIHGEVLYEWDRRRVLFSHGDMINPRDYGYRVFRAITHNPASKLLIGAVPGSFLDQLGRSLSHASRQYNPQANDETVRMFRNYACEQITKGADFVVMGHSHFLDDIRFKCGGHTGQYINNGFPRRDSKYLEIRPGESAIRFCEWEDYISPLKALPPV